MKNDLNKSIIHIINKTIAGVLMMSLCIVCGYAQTMKSVTGTVESQTGEPLTGVNVSVDGTTNGTITDIDGVFTLNVEKGVTLKVSYIGFVTRLVKVGDETKLKIILTEDSQALEEVVVIGYGTQKKVDLTGSVGVVNMEAPRSYLIPMLLLCCRGRFRVFPSRHLPNRGVRQMFVSVVSARLTMWGLYT